MIWDPNLMNKLLLIVFCVVFIKTISCRVEDPTGLQKYNSKLDLSHQLNDDDDYSYIDRSEDGGVEEDGGDEEVQGNQASEDPSKYLMPTLRGKRFESLHPTPPRTLAAPRSTRFRREYIREYRRHGGLRHAPKDHRHYNSHRGSHKIHGHGHHGSSHQGKNRSIKKTKVTMPSGTKYYITRPNMSKWHCGTKSTPTELITLNPNGKMGKKEYDMVAQEMKASGTGLNYQIVKIEKVVNGCFWKRYRARQSVIHGDGKKVNERMLFHGSRKMTEILKSGFDERHAAITGAFGPGIYFSPHSSTSHGFTGASAGVDGKMLLCRVTVGNLYKAPTYPDRHSHAPPGFHSVGGGAAIGDLNNEVIVYRGEQAYAEYMITYKL